MRARFATLGLTAGFMLGCVGPIAPHTVPVSEPRPAALAGDLYLPGGAGPHPAVILLHGCGGPQPNGTAWAEWLRAEGYAALVLDSFSGRGIRRLCGDSSPLTGSDRHADVFAAAASLAGLPAIDRARIAAMGFSHGGWTVLWAHQMGALRSAPGLRAFIALYPYCGDIASLRGKAPLLMLLGAQDDWTPAGPCERLAREARQDGRPVSAITYPGAGHAFDGAHIRGRVHIREARRGQGATVEYNPAAHADAERRVRDFLARYLRA
jgi:dienelactone hydrolase